MKQAFTLVELLVVITIIVILIALLLPGMQQAIYQSELTVCGARLDAIASSVTTYATGNKRRYPYRPTLAESGRWLRPNGIANASDAAQNTAGLGNPTIDATIGGRFDDRPYLRNALGGSLKLLLDPLCGKVDLDYTTQATDTFSNYMLWFGMRYKHALGGTGMYKLGDRIEWTDDSRGSAGKTAFSVLASDEDTRYEFPGGESYYHWLSSHSDRDNFLFLHPYQTTSLIFSRWTQLTSAIRRGPVDLNYAFTDGSVVRSGNVKWDDERMANVPYDTAASNWGSANKVWVHMPKP